MDRINMLGNIYYRGAMIKGAYEYYSLYERLLETKDADQEVMSALNLSVKALLGETSGGPIDEALQRIDSARKINTQKVQVLTVYADMVRNYEYVLNRLEERYQEEAPVDENMFMNRLFQYIFSVKDNMVINQNIKECIGQLPVRMTKKHYFDLIRNSLTIYKGSDYSSLASYLYMLRTGAMLYQPEEMDLYFTEYKKVTGIFMAADYENLSKEEYDKLTGMLQDMAEDLVRKTDFYVAVQELINSLYTALLSLSFIRKEVWEKEGEADFIFKEISRLIEEDKKEKISEALEAKLVVFEGQQERIFEKINREEGAAFEMLTDNTAQIRLKLEKMGKLMASSLFISFDEELQDKTAEESDLMKEADKFTAELSDFFQKNEKLLNRAVMANTLNKLPVFFNTTEEVMDYIKNSLRQCSDFSEKNVSMKLLTKIMDTY